MSRRIPAVQSVAINERLAVLERKVAEVAKGENALALVVARARFINAEELTANLQAALTETRAEVQRLNERRVILERDNQRLERERDALGAALFKARKRKKK